MACKNCEKRKDALNRMTPSLRLGDKVEMIASPIDDVRRKMLKSFLIAPFLIKNTLLSTSYKLVGATIEATDTQADMFLSQFSTLAHYLFQKNGEYPSKPELLGELAKHREHFEPGSLGYSWMSQVNFFGKEIMPGWTLDYAPHGNWYAVILASKEVTLINDDRGIHYEAITPDKLPKASSLKRASDFPAAVPVDLFVAPTAAKVRSFFRPVRYPMPQTRCTCNSSCTNKGCSGLQCQKQCCPNCNCTLDPPTGGTKCYFNYGKSDCGWIYTLCAATCGTNICTNCSRLLWGGCCSGCDCLPGAFC